MSYLTSGYIAAKYVALVAPLPQTRRYNVSKKNSTHSILHPPPSIIIYTSVYLFQPLHNPKIDIQSLYTNAHTHTHTSSSSQMRLYSTERPLLIPPHLLALLNKHSHPHLRPKPLLHPRREPVPIHPVSIRPLMVLYCPPFWKLVRQDLLLERADSFDGFAPLPLAVYGAGGFDGGFVVGAVGEGEPDGHLCELVVGEFTVGDSGEGEDGVGVGGGVCFFGG